MLPLPFLSHPCFALSPTCILRRFLLLSSPSSRPITNGHFPLSLFPAWIAIGSKDIFSDHRPPPLRLERCPTVLFRRNARQEPERATDRLSSPKYPSPRGGRHNLALSELAASPISPPTTLLLRPPTHPSPPSPADDVPSLPTTSRLILPTAAVRFLPLPVPASGTALLRWRLGLVSIVQQLSCLPQLARGCEWEHGVDGW